MMNNNKEKKKSELKKLNELIQHHSNLYYNESNPSISDDEYDELCIKRKKLELEINASGTDIGATPSENFQKKNHLKPMLSLANAFSKKDIFDFIARIKRFLSLDEKTKITLLCEPKIDGVSISLIYKNGILTNALTRGNGYIGEDITKNVHHMFPEKITSDDFPQEIEIRGEIYIEHNEFEIINKKTNNRFLNPRNAASGSIRHLDPNTTKERNLKYFMYTIGYSDKKIGETQFDVLKKLKKWNFSTNETFFINDNIINILEWHKQIQETIRTTLPYDIDGLVYKVNDLFLQERLGYANRYPRWAIAHKFPAKKVKTIIEDIVIQVGRTGVLTPIAELKPINISGTIVTRATLHNKDEIEKKDIRISDTVIIQKAGEIIPQVLSVDLTQRKQDAKKFIFPNTCPSCKQKVIHTNKKDVAIRCINEFNCPAQLIAKLIHFVSREAFDINGLGKKQIENLFNLNLLKYSADIFELKNKNLSSLENWGEKSTSNLINEIEQKKQINLSKFIYALGIRFVGTNTAKTMSLYLKTYENFCKMLDNQNNEAILFELENIDGIGQSVIDSIKHFIKQKNNLQQLEKLSKILTIKQDEEIQSNSIINNKTIVFTGTLEKMTRAEAKSIAEKLGAKVANTITKNTNFLVSNTKNSTKLQKASELGVTILNEEDWMKIAEQNQKTQIQLNEKNQEELF